MRPIREHMRSDAIASRPMPTSALGSLRFPPSATLLCLALALGLAESMGGRLLARNHPDGGFDVELRLARA